MHTFITLSWLEVNMGTQVVVGNKDETQYYIDYWYGRDNQGAS